MIHAELPHFFAYRSATDLVRIGRDHDGGYLVSESDIKHSELLIGLGVNDDWSFEEEFKKRRDIPILAYDASVSGRYFRKLFIKKLFAIDNPIRWIRALKKWLSYRAFFSRSDVEHVEKFVGLKTEDDQHCTLDDILKSSSTKSIFMKIDIEGSEYRLLDHLISHQDRLVGLVIEFHDCDLQLSRIKSFIEQFQLHVIHIHANNSVPVSRDDQLPTVIEMTFSRHAQRTESRQLPHPLDMQCHTGRPEIHIKVNESA